jgi:hypothetical protein
MSNFGDEIFRPNSQISQIVTAKTGLNKLKYRGRQILMEEKQSYERPRHPKRVEFNPSTNVAVPFGGSQQITEFRVYEQHDFEQVEWITLRGQITKAIDATQTNGVHQLCEPSPLWVERIEILTGGSTTIVHTLYGDQIWYALTTLPQEKLATFLQNNLLYMGADFKVNNILHREVSGSLLAARDWRTKTTAAAYSRPFVIPILGTLLEKFRLRLLNGDTIFRVYWHPLIASQVASPIVNPSAAFPIPPTLHANSFVPSSTSSAFFSLGSMQLVLESEEVLERDKMMYEQMVKQGPVFAKFLEPVVQTFTQVISNSTENQFQLTAIYGDIAFMQIYCRSAVNPLHCPVALAPENSGEALLMGAAVGGSFNSASDYQDADFAAYINITDSSNKQLFSPNGFKVWDLRYAHHSKSLPNIYANTVASYLIPFCENPAAAIHDGAIDGYANFCGSEYVRIRPSPSFASGTYRLTVVAWKIKYCAIERGIAALV